MRRSVRLDPTNPDTYDNIIPGRHAHDSAGGAGTTEVVRYTMNLELRYCSM